MYESMPHKCLRLLQAHTQRRQVPEILNSLWSFLRSLAPLPYGVLIRLRLQSAASHGHVLSIYRLGVMQMNGMGTPRKFLWLLSLG
jgi:hypothetical protein